MKIALERANMIKFDETLVEHLHRYAFILKYIKDKKVLDLASGEGYGSNLIADFANEVTGVDIDEESVNNANKKYQKQNLKYVKSSAEDLIFEDESFDVIISFETIEHIINQEAVLKEFKRVLKKGGLLIMSTPDLENYSIRRPAPNLYHVKEIYLQQFKDLINSEFEYSSVFYQDFIYSSLIYSESNSISSINEYFGDSRSIKEKKLSSRLFNIIIASDEKLIVENELSIFNGDAALQNTFLSIKKSTTWVVGSTILKPLIFIKRLLGK